MNTKDEVIDRTAVYECPNCHAHRVTGEALAMLSVDPECPCCHEHKISEFTKVPDDQLVDGKY